MRVPQDASGKAKGTLGLLGSEKPVCGCTSMNFSFFVMVASISQVISQLRVLSRSVAAGSKFDRELWSNGLSPVLHLWKKLNQVSSLLSSIKPFLSSAALKLREFGVFEFAFSCANSLSVSEVAENFNSERFYLKMIVSGADSLTQTSI